MSVLIWGALAAGAVLVGVALAMGRILAHPRGGGLEPEAGEARVPPAPLQRRALGGLAIGLALTLSVLAVLIVAGPEAYHTDLRVRLLVYALLIGGLVGYLLLAVATRRDVRQGRLVIDERDEAILARAPAMQAVAVLATVVVWTIALTEAYWDRGEIPIVFPTLIFWSSLVMYLVAYPIGILLGYRRAG